MPEIEIPEELEELLEETSTFRRRMAVVVVLVTLFGAVIAYLHDVESNIEENAAQEAQRSSVDALAGQNSASSVNSLQLSHVFQQQLLDAAKRAADGTQLEQLPGSSGENQALSDAARFKAVQDALAKEEGKAADLDQVTGLVAQQEQTAFKAQLVNTVRSQQANDHGNKADAYVAVLAVIAVGLFLVGLSLTIEAKGRYYLAGPGIVIIIICMFWSLTIAQRGALQVSSDAIDLTSQGQALTFQSKFQDAKDKYDQAIADSPQFADAYLQRSEVLLSLGNREPDVAFDSVVDPDLAKQAADDANKAIALGKGSDINAVIDAGFANFLVGDDGQAESLSREATNLSPTNPLGWFNLGVTLVAEGKEKQANQAYDQALALTDEVGQGDDVVAPSLLASALTDLEVAATRKDADTDLISSVKGRLAAKGYALDPDLNADPQVSDSPGVDGDITLKTRGDQLTADFDVKDMAVDDAISTVIYFRRAGADDNEAFVALPFRTLNFKVNQDEIDQGIHLSLFPTDCLDAGTYKVEIFSGEKFLKDGSIDIAEGPFGGLKLEGTDVSDTSVCRPEAWSTDSLNEQADGTPDPDGQGVAYKDPDTGASLVVRLYRPIPEDEGLPVDQLLDDTIGFAAETDSNSTLTKGSVGAGSAGDPLLVLLDDGSSVCLPTRTAKGTASVGDATGQKIEVIAVQGADKVLRVVILTAPAQDALDDMVTELVPRVTFSKTGVTDTGSVDCP